MRLHQIRVGPVSVVLKRRENRDTETDMGKERHATISGKMRIIMHLQTKKSLKLSATTSN